MEYLVYKVCHESDSHHFVSSHIKAKVIAVDYLFRLSLTGEGVRNIRRYVCRQALDHPSSVVIVDSTGDGGAVGGGLFFLLLHSKKNAKDGTKA